LSPLDLGGGVVYVVCTVMLRYLDSKEGA
jgi:hypothetical protein